jgi:hypothetical protein
VQLADRFDLLDLRVGRRRVFSGALPPAEELDRNDAGDHRGGGGSAAAGR